MTDHHRTERDLSETVCDKLIAGGAGRRPARRPFSLGIAADQLKRRQTEALLRAALERTAGRPDLLRRVGQVEPLREMTTDPVLELGDQDVAAGQVAKGRRDTTGRPLVHQEPRGHQLVVARKAASASRNVPVQGPVSRGRS